MSKNRNIILFTLVSFSFFCCGDRDADKQIVATVGDQAITFPELEISFLLEPQYMKRMPLSQARRNQLDYLVQNKYYYLAATEMNLAAEPLLQPRISYIKDTEIRKKFINDKFLKAVRIEPEETRQGLYRLAEKRLVQNYFTQNVREAKQLQQNLQSGILDQTLFFDLQAEDLGYISFGDLDQAVEDAVFQLDTMTCSPVVQTRYGYHILRVAGRVENADFKNLNDQIRMQQVTDIILKRKADGLIREFLEHTAAGAKIQVNNRTLEVLLTFVRESDDRKEINPLVMVPPVSNRELITIEHRLKDIYNQPLVRFKAEEITAGAFIERLKEMPPFHRPHIKGRQFLLKSILDMMRNDLLLDEARRAGYAGKTSVRDDYQEQINEFLAHEFGLRLNSRSFQVEDSLAWHTYQKVYLETKKDYDLMIYQDHLFSDVADADSVMSPAPLPVFLKNRYIW